MDVKEESFNGDLQGKKMELETQVFFLEYQEEAASGYRRDDRRTMDAPFQLRGGFHAHSSGV